MDTQRLGEREVIASVIRYAVWEGKSLELCDYTLFPKEHMAHYPKQTRYHLTLTECTESIINCSVCGLTDVWNGPTLLCKYYSGNSLEEAEEAWAKAEALLLEREVE